jgi:protein-tyrosine-phosphatase
MKNILILCTGNSARSILAEVLFNELGGGRVHAWSAGSHPKGAVHPRALAKLRSEGFSTEALRSKSWDEFARPGAPVMDIVITVCDSAAGESCPIWPGAPVRAHWGIPDPAQAAPEEATAAFDTAYWQTRSRIEQLLALDFEAMEPRELTAALNRIGATSEGATEAASAGTAA